MAAGSFDPNERYQRCLGAGAAATSALLSIISAVKEFGRSLTKWLGAPAGEVEPFIEVEFDLDGRKVIDGR